MSRGDQWTLEGIPQGDGNPILGRTVIWLDCMIVASTTPAITSSSSGGSPSRGPSKAEK